MLRKHGRHGRWLTRAATRYPRWAIGPRGGFRPLIAVHHHGLVSIGSQLLKKKLEESVDRASGDGPLEESRRHSFLAGHGEFSAWQHYLVRDR
jgi:hypothetical protein